MSIEPRTATDEGLGERVEVCRVPLVPWTQQELVSYVGRCADDAVPATLFPMYAHCINVAQRDDAFMQVLRDRSRIAYADGMAVVWASRIGGRGVPERCTTTDLFPQLMEQAARRGHRVFFLGAAPGVAALCAERMVARYDGLQVVGTRDGFFGPELDEDVISEINDATPDIVFVGMGMPHQEKWVAAHRHRLRAPAVMTCGATFDFHSGRVRRAPLWMRRSGLEWLFRLLLEPRRLWRRYLLGNAAFIWYVTKHRAGPRPSARAGRVRSRGAR